MIKVSIMYPRVDGSRFDVDYYVNRHIPDAVGKLDANKALRGVSVERGLAGGVPGSAPTYWVITHMLFDSVPDFLGAFAPVQADLAADMPNFTDVAPVVQVGEIAYTR